ncbi:DUF3043 domain-containing protein [Nocardioidaceae bacterium SCSIO 66511]|nr:DUF3043 domain-containing protein [Nocardioidaceae bacterium SCSIO 66511]
MPLFRRSSNSQDVPEEAPEPDPSGKGRATPKRKEAEAARKARVKPPRTRKEAAKVMRQKRYEERMKTREAMETGDDRYLPARDRGKVRGFVRNFVDSRYNVAEFLLPLLVVILLLSFLQTEWAVLALFGLWIVTIIGTLLDTIYLIIRVRRELKKRFPGESTRGCLPYAVLRSTQLRRFRMPKPQLKRGQPIP